MKRDLFYALALVLPVLALVLIRCGSPSKYSIDDYMRWGMGRPRMLALSETLTGTRPTTYASPRPV